MNTSAGQMHRSIKAIACFSTIILATAGAQLQAQNLFVSQANGVIDKITAGGSVSTFASGFTVVWDMAFDQSGNLFVSDLDNGYADITEFPVSGGQVTFATSLNNPSGMVAPMGLAFDSQGDLFTADQATGKVLEFADNGGTLNSTPTVFASGFNQPYSLAFNASGNLFVGDLEHSATAGTITEITPGGVQIPFASGFAEPTTLAFDNSGNLYAADEGGNNITKISSTGVKSTFASGLDYPYGLAYNTANGNMYEADLASGKIYEFNSNGGRSTFVSLTPSEPLTLAFQNEPLPVPEPTALSLLSLSALCGAALFRRPKKS
jgi:sugar lactone lactonase YvrE